MSPYETSGYDTEHGSTTEYATRLSPVEDLIRHHGYPEGASDTLVSVIDHARAIDQLQTDIDSLRSTIFTTMTGQISTLETRRDESQHHIGERLVLLGGLGHALEDLAVAQDRVALQLNSVESQAGIQRKELDACEKAIATINQEINGAQTNLTEQAAIASPFSTRLGSMYMTAQKRLTDRTKADGTQTVMSHSSQPPMLAAVAELRTVMTNEELEEEQALLDAKSQITQAVTDFQVTFNRLKDELATAHTARDTAANKLQETENQIHYLGATIMPNLDERFTNLRSAFIGLYEDFQAAKTEYDQQLSVSPIEAFGRTKDLLDDRSAETAAPTDSRWQKTYDQRAGAIKERSILENMSDNVRLTIRHLAEVDTLLKEVFDFNIEFIQKESEPIISGLTTKRDEFMSLLFVRSQDAAEAHESLLDLAMRQHDNDYNRTAALKDSAQANEDLETAHATRATLTETNTALLTTIGQIKSAIDAVKQDRAAIENEARERFEVIETARLDKVLGNIPMSAEERAAWIEHDMTIDTHGAGDGTSNMWFSEKRAEFQGVADGLISAENLARYKVLEQKILDAQTALTQLENEYQERTQNIADIIETAQSLGKEITDIRQYCVGLDVIDVQQMSRLERANATLTLLSNDYEVIRSNFAPFAGVVETVEQPIEQVEADIVELPVVVPNHDDIDNLIEAETEPTDTPYPQPPDHQQPQAKPHSLTTEDLVAGLENIILNQGTWKPRLSRLLGKRRTGGGIKI